MQAEVGVLPMHVVEAMAGVMPLGVLQCMRGKTGCVLDVSVSKPLTARAC